jgi:hypothetical protein
MKAMKPMKNLGLFAHIHITYVSIFVNSYYDYFILHACCCSPPEIRQLLPVVDMLDLIPSRGLGPSFYPDFPFP